MQQFSRVCMIADHDQRQIEYVCVFPECNLSRLACNKCVKIFNHKHQQQDQSHVLDQKELYEVVSEKLSKRQMQQGIILDFEKSDQQLKELLLKLRNNGFNQFDDISINILLNIDKKVVDNNTQLLNQSNIMVQNTKGIKELCDSKQQDNGLNQKIKDSKYKVITQNQVKGGSLGGSLGGSFIYSSAISNDQRYIVSGGKKLKIWNYTNNKLMKSIQLNSIINKIKFTNDSRLLYVGTFKNLHQFDVNNNFKETYKEMIHSKRITNIYCITNTIILTSSYDNTIIKTDVNLKQQLLLIKAHDIWVDELDGLNGLDYNQNLDIIASSTYDKSIKIWNGNNGQLVLEKQNAHNCEFGVIFQVLFIIEGNKLVSLDNLSTILVWMINYETKQLEQQQIMSDNNGISNISLVLNQQYITLVCSECIKIYSIKGDYIKQLNHNIEVFMMFNTIQPQSMKAIIVQGQYILKICKVKIDFD